MSGQHCLHSQVKSVITPFLSLLFASPVYLHFMFVSLHFFCAAPMRNKQKSPYFCFPVKQFSLNLSSFPSELKTGGEP
jgi:hypothetical protein